MKPIHVKLLDDLLIVTGESAGPCENLLAWQEALGNILIYVMSVLQICLICFILYLELIFDNC